MGFPQEDFTHPEKSCQGLIWAPNGTLPASVDDVDSHASFSSFKPHELCWFCGWTTLDQVSTSYISRIRYITSQNNRGIWALGSQLLIKDVPNDGYSPGNDYVTQKLLSSQPGFSIPLISRLELLSQPTDKTYLLLMSRDEGQPLSRIWRSLSTDQRSNIRKQLFVCLKELRQFTSPIVQTVDGRALDDIIISNCHTTPPRCKQIGSTEKWFENIGDELRVGISVIHQTKDPVVIEAELQKLKDNFPNPEPYTLSHGDLNLGNILVKEDTITAIIDWEYAGYYPWWVERWRHEQLLMPGCNELLERLWPRLSPNIRNGLQEHLSSNSSMGSLSQIASKLLRLVASSSLLQKRALGGTIPYSGYGWESKERSPDKARVMAIAGDCCFNVVVLFAVL
jgi:hypothetical protein